MKKCPYCAEEIQDDAKVCRYCGKDIEIKTGNKAMEVGNKLTQAGSSMMKIGLVITFIVILLFVLFR